MNASIDDSTARRRNKSVDRNARKQAQLQWDTTACGEVSGEKGTLDYFLEVERKRYATQHWMHDYFDFRGFRDRKVLEVGIGQGTDLVQFYAGGARCYGIDITRQHLELTEQNFNARGMSVELKESDATDIQHGDSTFDCVYSFGVLHHIPEIERCIAEAHRVLKPGGTFYLGLYHKWSAFHLFRMLLFEGILRGGLLRRGYAGVMATIEQGADGERIKPLVRTYSKRQLRRLLDRFDIRDISIHQLHARHFCVPDRLAPMFAPLIRMLQPVMGWYVVSTAYKR